MGRFLRLTYPSSIYTPINMSALKDIYSLSFYERLSPSLKEVIPGFDQQLFVSKIFSPEFETMELKQRMRHTSLVLHEFLDPDFSKSIRLIEKLITSLRKRSVGEDHLGYIFLPDYVEVFGLDHYAESVYGLELITQFITCEFAVRPFLLKYPAEMIPQMKIWSKHENHKVRRLATEGIRPRLPWAMAVPALKKDPLPILEILENLKTDVSDSVRRSVANNLNDIAKDHPEVVIGIARKWKGISKETDAIVKHGCRTLLKQGHADVLQIYGLDSKGIEVDALQILTPEVNIGDSLEFAFTVENNNPGEQTIRLEYALYYKKAKGHLAKKVFKISERVYQPNEKSTIQRKQSFRIITTRTFYTGEHELAIIVNGDEKPALKFQLK